MLDVDDENEINRGAGATRPRLRWIVLGTVAAVALAAVALLAGGTEPRDGAQTNSGESIVLRPAAVVGWQPLEPVAGGLRPGFPGPMVSRADEICIGFARDDFGPDDRRPSLARCVSGTSDHVMASNEIRSLLSIASGFDTWHFIEAADTVEDVSVLDATGEPLRGERIHLSDSTIALRLENGTDLSSIEWSTGAATYRCVPDPTAWSTSTFCPNP